MSITSSLTTSTKQSSKTNPGNVQPVLRDVQKDDTVEHRLTGLIDDNSKYIQQARDNSAQQANRRGLINSSIAAGAGQKAAIESALPIAQQDAQTYYDQGKTNQSAQNTFKQNEQAFGMNTQLKEQEQKHALGRMNLENTHKIGQMNVDQGHTLERMDIDQIYKQDNMNLDQSNKVAFATVEHTFGMESDTHKGGIQAMLIGVQADANLSGDAKRTFITQVGGIMDQFQTTVREIGLSKKSPEQQANAITQARTQRDADIATLTALTTDSQAWTW